MNCYGIQKGIFSAIMLYLMELKIKILKLNFIKFNT